MSKQLPCSETWSIRNIPQGGGHSEQSEADHQFGDMDVVDMVAAAEGDDMVVVVAAEALLNRQGLMDV